MEGLVLVLIILGLIVFDVIALRFGSDSRPVEDSRHNWH